MRSIRANGYGAVILTLALLLPAAPALAQVASGTFVITDAKEPDATATVNHTAASNTGTAQTICRNGSSTATVSANTTHPESVELSTKVASLAQGDPSNKPTVRVIGAVGMVFNVVLTCDEAELSTRVNMKLPRTGRFQVQASACSGLSLTQLEYLRDTCAADAANTTIDLRTAGLVVTRLRIRAKGDVN